MPPAPEHLRPPDARQGPGPMPGAAIDAIEPALTRLVVRTLPGGARANGVGLSTELAQLRPYETGDDVRYIDPAASARTGTMHVRLHVPERALTTWILLDVSASMAFGTEGRLKADVAEGVALVFGRLGVRRAGSVGVITFGSGPGGHGGAHLRGHVAARAASGGVRASRDDGVRVLPPRGSKPGLVALRRVLADGVAVDGRPDPHALSAGLAHALRVARQPGLVALVSDFREQQNWERPLGALALRHAVIAVEVADPRESALPDVGRLALVDPETGTLVRVDSSSPRLRERFAAIERERRAAVHRELRRLAVHHIALDTDGDWLRELGRRIR